MSEPKITDDWLRQRFTKGLDLNSSSDFDLNEAAGFPQGHRFKAASVLIPLVQRAGHSHVILTKRATGLRHHPGQVSFPGGKVDPGDNTPKAAALREAHEEIGLPAEAVEIIGSLPPHETVTSFSMQPFVGLVNVDFQPEPEFGEVEEVFEVPLTHLINPAHFMIHQRVWFGQLRRYYTVPYGPYYIWGATARILRTLADCLGKK